MQGVDFGAQPAQSAKQTYAALIVYTDVGNTLSICLFYCLLHLDKTSLSTVRSMPSLHLEQVKSRIVVLLQQLKHAWGEQWFRPFCFP